MRERLLANATIMLDRLIGPLLLLSAVLLVAGITAPFMQVKRFFIFTDAFSLVDAVVELFGNGDYLLGAVILVFSIVFPLLKIALALWIWLAGELRGARPPKALRRLERIGRWSMLDVFVAALVVFSAKASAVADATAEIGLYLFVASILIAMLAMSRLNATATPDGDGA